VRADEGDCRILLQQARQWVQEAERRYDQGDLPRAQAAAIQALPLAEKAFERCPGTSDAMDACSMGVFASVFENDYAKGRLWLDRYASRTAYGERDPQLHFLRALVQARLVKRYDLALRSLEKMQAVEPRFEPRRRDLLYLDTLLLYGQALSRHDKFDEALRQFHTAALVARRLGIPLREQTARANAGITYRRDDRLRESAEIFRALHKEDPQNPIWSYQLGLTLAGLGQFLPAIEAYRDSLAKQKQVTLAPELRDEVARARLRLGNCLKLHALSLGTEERAKYLKEALETLKLYIQERPDDPLGHLYAGMLLYEEHRDFAAALGYFREAWRLDWKCENALRFLLNAHEQLPSPPKPGGAVPTAEEQAAWLAERAALAKDLEENSAKRTQQIAAAAAESGDVHGGCR
jgi:tetratricopeptide (TPR) repeat protein